MGRHQADRPCAVNRNAFTRQQTGKLCCMPACREDIREHDIVILTLLGIFRQHQAVEIRIGHTQQLGLPALIRAHLGKTVSRARSTRIRCKAESSEAFLTVLTEPAADIER